jgi:hypothetical protein
VKRGGGFAVAVLIPTLPLTVSADDAALENRFNDPFMQVRSALAGCPEPIGPRVTADEAKREGHARVERGTSCWLAGQCEKPNAYLYDAGIATSVAARFEDKAQFARSTLWITVQRRFVWVQGCVADDYPDGALESFLAGVPDAERLIVEVVRGTALRPPYRVMPAQK